MNENSRAVLFDLDGVLIDSESVYSEFWTEIDRIYPTGIDNFALAIKGTTLPQIMSHYSDEAVKADIEDRIEKFQRTLRFNLFAGVAEFLSGLNSRGIPAAIVTSSDPEKMRSLFAQIPELQQRVDVVIDASRVTRSKPDPQGYLLAASELGVDPADCFVFEDSLQGLAAGRASGATVIAVATTYPRDVVMPYADRVIDGLQGFTVSDMLSVRKSC